MWRQASGALGQGPDGRRDAAWALLGCGVPMKLEAAYLVAGLPVHNGAAGGPVAVLGEKLGDLFAELLASLGAEQVGTGAEGDGLAAPGLAAAGREAPEGSGAEAAVAAAGSLRAPRLPLAGEQAQGAAAGSGQGAVGSQAKPDPTADSPLGDAVTGVAGRAVSPAGRGGIAPGLSLPGGGPSRGIKDARAGLESAPSPGTENGQGALGTAAVAPPQARGSDQAASGRLLDARALPVDGGSQDRLAASGRPDGDGLSAAAVSTEAAKPTGRGVPGQSGGRERAEAARGRAAGAGPMSSTEDAGHGVLTATSRAAVAAAQTTVAGQALASGHAAAASRGDVRSAAHTARGEEGTKAGASGAARGTVDAAHQASVHAAAGSGSSSGGPDGGQAGGAGSGRAGGEPGSRGVNGGVVAGSGADGRPAGDGIPRRDRVRVGDVSAPSPLPAHRGADAAGPSNSAAGFHPQQGSAGREGAANDFGAPQPSLLLASQDRSGGEMRLHVRPQGLGELEMHISVRDGGVQAAFWSPSDQTRELLLQSRQMLQAQLGRSHLRLDGFTVGNGSHHGGGGAWHGGGAGGEPRAGERTPLVTRVVGLAEAAAASSVEETLAQGLSVRG